MTEVEEWCKGSIKGTKLPAANRAIAIQTLEGETLAEVGDYIIKGIDGEFCVCKSELFEASHDRVLVAI